jgi:hypothetical protein
MDPERVVFERELASASFRDSTDEEDFSSILARFKRRGCGMLMTGAVSDSAVAHAFRMLGGASDVDRKRVVVVPDRNERDPELLVPDGVGLDDESVRTITASGDPFLDHLQTVVLDAILQFDISEHGLAPGQLRLLVADLDAVVEPPLDSTTERFLRSILLSVRGVRGMAYVHVPTDSPDDELVELFDGWIELREGGSSPQHRWHLPERGWKTSWMRL